MEKRDMTCIWRSGKKEVSANGVPYERVADHIGHHAAVMIAPDDMSLINEGSEGRRRWIDSHPVPDRPGISGAAADLSAGAAAAQCLAEDAGVQSIVHASGAGIL